MLPSKFREYKRPGRNSHSCNRPILYVEHKIGSVFPVVKTLAVIEAVAEENSTASLTEEVHSESENI